MANGPEEKGTGTLCSEDSTKWQSPAELANQLLRDLYPARQVANGASREQGTPQPGFEFQSRNVLKIPQVARQQRRIDRQNNARDPYVHRADSDTLASQILKNVGGVRVPLEHVPLGKELDAPTKTLVGHDLLAA